MDYLDEEIISRWSRDVQTFLMQLSLADSFTPELARAVTGNDDAELLLSRAERAGNILSCAGGEWRIRPVLLETLGQPLGFYTSFVGPQNQFVHLWAYESLDDYERRSLARDTHPNFSAYLAASQRLITAQETRLIRAVDMPAWINKA